MPLTPRGNPTVSHYMGTNYGILGNRLSDGGGLPVLLPPVAGDAEPDPVEASMARDDSVHSDFARGVCDSVLHCFLHLLGGNDLLQVASRRNLRRFFRFRTDAGYPDCQFVSKRTGKWDKVYLEFNADPSTIDLILQKQYSPIPAKDVFETSEAPSWWTPNIDKPGTLIYVTDWQDLNALHRDVRPFFDHDLLIYDPESRKAFFRCRR